MQMNQVVFFTKVLNSLFYFLLLFIGLHELIISILILFTGKKYKLFGFLISWPLVLLIKRFSLKQYDRIMRVYNSRIYFYACCSIIGSILLIYVCILPILDIWK